MNNPIESVIEDRRLRPALVGAVSFSAVQAAWLVFGPSRPSARWVLEPSSGILLCTVIMAAVSFACAKSRRFPQPPLFLASLIWAGAMFALALWLLAVGPGNLWPIVLVIDAILMAPPVFGGTFAGWFFYRRR